MRKSIIVSCVGLLVLGLWTTRATERHDITPLNNIVVTQPTQASRAGAFCTLKHHNDTAAGFYSGYDNGIRTVSYFDPSSCGSPTYPFEIQSFSFTLFDDGGYQWPVLVDIVIFDISADNDSCSGPGAELCRTTVSCDSVTFAFPNVGTVSLATPCCVNGPFFFGIEYAGNDMGLGPLPSVVFDNQPTVAACFNWVYSLDSTWYEWNDFWSPPVPGYPMFWVEGETEGAFCSSAEPIIYTPEGLHDNYEGLLGERVSVIGYYTGAGDNMLVSDLGEYLKDEPMSAKSEVMLRGDTLTDTLDLAFITATGYLQAEADPLSIYPDDTVTLRLYLHSVEKILDPKPVPSPPGEGYLDNGYDLSVPSAVCDSCKFAILISGGVNEANNHDRYWNNLDMLYNHKIDNEGYCAENIKVLYYNGVSENTAEIPQANVDSCTIAKVEAAHNDIAQRIAACNRAGKKSTLQKLITNHGAPGGINMLGNEVLDGGTFRSYQQKCIDSCCAFLFDEMVQCYGGNVADSLRSIDDKGKTEIKVNSGAGNVLHWSTAEDALFLRVKLDSLAAGRTYDEAVAAAAEEYGKYLDSLAARYRRWITEDSLWLAAHPPTGGPGDTVRNRVRRDTSRWRGYSNGITAGRDSTQGRSNIWVRLQMKRFCNWKSVVVPAGGQFCLEFKGDSTHCGNVTVYKDSVSGIHVLRTKVAVWNWNIPGSAGYVDGNNPRYLNGDSAKATTFWIHNDDGEYSITVTLRTDQPDAESASNENAFAGWSMGGTDSLSTEFGDFIAPFVNLIDVNQPGFQLFQIPRLWGQCGTPQVQAEHMILEPTPWHQAMQLRLVVANVINPGNVNFTISDADNPNGSFNITQPGEYTFDCGAIAPSTSPQWIMIDAGLSGGCFEIDSWALRSTVLDAPPSCCVGTRGDVNGDGNNLDIVDLTCVVDFLFGEGCAMSCMDEADINGDGSAGSDIVDLTCAVDFLFGDPGGCVAACP